ncbi:MAG TPA: YgiQ family radical SAM protein [Deltaproteobacteria bacterium]|nr:YgiQ family radical SAM protein [Deltaproteobacteria bacterium]
MYLPTTKQELESLGWDRPDIILITGDAYMDSPHIGVSLVGKALMADGFRVGIIAQPDIRSAHDITRLGEPALFWGVSSGSLDSMVANYTPLKKRRKSDDYTPGGMNTRRPDRACIVYTNLIRRYSRTARPIVLGGIEASLRRIAHYDFWSDSVRRSILFDAKADILVYGMGEYTAVELARRFRTGRAYQDLPGICTISKQRPSGYREIPAFETVSTDPDAFIAMFHEFMASTKDRVRTGIVQAHGDRFLVQNPAWPDLSERELDASYALGFERDTHPYYAAQGQVKAMDTIRFSLSTHRGCFGGCRFCSIPVHEGRTVQSRSRNSLITEARTLKRHPRFTGTLLDVGGPTANMYAARCSRSLSERSCGRESCLEPRPCEHFVFGHAEQIRLLRDLRNIPGIHRVFVASGIRHDLVLADRSHGENYLEELIRHHVSGQMKIAPEHCSDHVLSLMGKPGTRSLKEFRDAFFRLTNIAGKNQFLTYYLMAAHPGCTLEDMEALHAYVKKVLRINPEQVQIFTPTPSTYASLMYHTGIDPFSGNDLFVEKTASGKQRQKGILVKTEGRRQ